MRLTQQWPCTVQFSKSKRCIVQIETNILEKYITSVFSYKSTPSNITTISGQQVLQAELCSLAWITLQPWTWGQQASLKGWAFPRYMPLHPEIHTLQGHCHENLKCNINFSNLYQSYNYLIIIFPVTHTDTILQNCCHHICCYRQIILRPSYP